MDTEDTTQRHQNVTGRHGNESSCQHLDYDIEKEDMGTYIVIRKVCKVCRMILELTSVDKSRYKE